MITVTVSGKKIQINANMALSDFLQTQALNSPGFAVTINKNHIPRDSYSSTHLNDHDEIDIITPMQGG